MLSVPPSSILISVQTVLLLVVESPASTKLEATACKVQESSLEPDQHTHVSDQPSEPTSPDSRLARSFPFQVFALASFL
jgi:hypothetical protein